MFRQLQLKMTLFFTLVLMGILLVTNVSIYFLLTTYNQYQLARETETMLLSIEDFEWVKESESTEIDNNLTSPSDAQVNGGDGTDTTDTTDTNTETDPKTQNSSDDRKHGSTEDATESDEEDEKKEDVQVPEDKETNDDENSSKSKDEDSSLKKESTIGVSTPLTLSALIKQSVSMTVFASSDTTTLESAEANEVRLPFINDVIIPSTLSSFSFYMISDMDGQMIKWQNTDERLLDTLISQSGDLVASATPTLIVFDESPKVYYLMSKMPIMNEGVQYGTYAVGRDVSPAYETLDNLTRIIIISTILGGVIALIGGYILGGHWIKPIKAAYESKQQFIADASHELRTPISVIMLSSDTLERDIPITETFQQQIVSDIKDEAKKMGGLVENLLYFARSDKGTYSIQRESMDLALLIQQNLTSFAYIAEVKKIRINSQVAAKLVLQGDRQQLSTVISVLLDNAVKYTSEEGTITVTASYIIQKKKQGIHFSVADNGSGIKEEALPHIFDRFYREEGSRSRETGGYGLGLAIAKEIVEKHGGSINVKSIMGVGSSFEIYLPVDM